MVTPKTIGMIAGYVKDEVNRGAFLEDLDIIFDLIPHPVVIRNTNEVVIRANRAARDWFGFDPCGLSRSTLDEAVDVRDLNGLPVLPEERPRRCALNGEAVVSRQMLCIFSNGSTKVVSASSAPLVKAGSVWGEVTVWEDITELDETRKALAKENEFVSTILATSGSLILVLSHDGRVTRMNRACEDMIGWKWEDVRGSYYWDLIVSEDERAGERKTFQRIIEGGTKNYEGRVIRRDGEQRWITWSATVSTQPDTGAVRYVFMLGIDITEIKHAQSTVEIEKHFSRQIVESCPAFFVLLTLDGDIIHMNRTALRTLGYSLEEVKGKSYASVIGCDSEGGDNGGRPQTEPGEGPTGSALQRVVSKSGRKMVIEWQHQETLREGRFNFLFSFGTDATERTRVMELFKKLFHNLPIGAFVTVDGSLVMANQHLERLTGYPESELKERHLGYQIYREDLEAAQRNAQQMLQGKTSTPYEYRLQTRDGDIRWVMETVTPIDYSGKRAMLGTCMDITDRKMLESQLLQAQKLESIGQLAAGIAHEINTPAQYVGDNLHFLKDACADMRSVLDEYRAVIDAVEKEPAYKDRIDRIRLLEKNLDVEYLCEEMPNAIDQSVDGVDRIAKIVGAMKEFSHPGTKEKKMVDVNRAIETTVTVSRNEWKYVADVEYSLDPSLPLISCLPAELNQVLLNIIVNAAQAIGDNGKGKGKGIIRVATGQPEPGWCEVKISDDGPGIPEPIRSRIFDPFFTTKEVGKGTGQGLAIARSVVVDKHNGSISVESETGKGATFTIRIPVGQGA